MKTVCIDNMDRFVEAASEVFGYNPMLLRRNLTLVYFGVYTGMRIQSILNLNIQDIKVNGEIVKSFVVHDKGKSREVFLNTRLRSMLTNYLMDKEYGILFPSQQHTRLTRQAVELFIKQIAEKAGLRNVNTHSLRKTFAQRVLDAGVDIETLRDLLGHSSILTTQRYIKSDQEKMRRAVEEVI